MSITISFVGADQYECIEQMREFLMQREEDYEAATKGDEVPDPEPAEEKPAPKKSRAKAKPKADEKEAEPEAEKEDEDAKYEKPARKKGKKIEFDDITEAASRLVKACDNDMKRAQELVYSEFGVRKVSKLAVEDYPKAHRWMHMIAEQMEDKADEKAAEQDDDGEE